jgi:hypothetical protein
MLHTQLRFIWPSGFRGEDFLEINQSEIKIACGGCLLTVLHTHFSPYSFFPPEKSVYTHFPPRKDQYILIFPPERSVHVYTHLSPWFLGEKSEYILTFPPHTQCSPFALIDYTRAITPIRGRPYGDFCRAFDAEEGRSPLFFSICNTFWNISQWLQFDPYVLFLAMRPCFFYRRIYNSQTIVYTP